MPRKLGQTAEARGARAKVGDRAQETRRRARESRKRELRRLEPGWNSQYKIAKFGLCAHPNQCSTRGGNCKEYLTWGKGLKQRATRESRMRPVFPDPRWLTRRRCLS